MKRLINSVSLIQLQNTNLKNDPRLRQLVFSLVCLQISFPKLFEMMMLEVNFSNWNQQFARKNIKTPELFTKALAAFEDFKKNYEEDFDEDWEEALFLLVWGNSWQRDRVVDASRFLSIILDNVFEGMDDDAEISKILEKAIKMTAVTSVASTDTVLRTSKTEGDKTQTYKDRNDYWKIINDKFKGTNCVFDPEVNPSPKINSKNSLKHKSSKNKNIEFTLFEGSTTPLMIEIKSLESEDSQRLYEKLSSGGIDLEDISKSTVRLSPVNEATTVKISFDPPKGIKKRKTIYKHQEIAIEIHNWLLCIVPKLETELISSINQLETELISSINQRNTSNEN